MAFKMCYLYKLTFIIFLCHIQIIKSSFSNCNSTIDGADLCNSNNDCSLFTQSCYNRSLIDGSFQKLGSSSTCDSNCTCHCFNDPDITTGLIYLYISILCMYSNCIFL